MKNYKIYIYTRYLGLPQTPNDFPIVPRYKYNHFVQNILFSNDRLDKRLFFFKELTLKSILSQTYENFEWILYVSNLLPEKYKKEIKGIDKRIKFIEICGENIQTRRVIDAFSPEEKDYIGCRIDDDDGLCSNYFELLNSEYSNDDSDFVVGTQESLGVSYENGKFLWSELKRKYLISVGLSCRNKHPYSLGSHAKVAERYKVKLISDHRSFPCLQAAGEQTFTNRKHVRSTNDFDINLYLSGN